MATLEREQLLQELIKIADGETTSAKSKTLLDLLRERLQCPEKQHGELPKVLDTILQKIVVDGREQALAAFQRNGGRFDTRTPDAAAAYVAAFGELLGLSDAGILNYLAIARRAVKRLERIRNDNNKGDYTRRQLAGMWFPRNIVDVRQVRRAYKDSKYKNGELILTNSMLDALTSYLDESENIRACRKQLDGAVRRRHEIAAQDATTWLAPGYVRRSEIEQRFSDLVDVEHAKHVAFIGQAGMGKTVVAKTLTTKFSSCPPAPLIRLIDGHLSTDDLQVALQRHEVTTARITRENARGNLIKLISDKNAPEFVILDNFENLDQVAALLPYHSASRIVATCRATGKAGLTKFNVISVSKMTSDEASAMAMKLIPGLSNADANDIAEVLGCYPLAINHACGLIMGTQVRVKDLCRELSRKPHDITEENEERETLCEILFRAVTALHDENPLAIELLTLIVLSGPFALKPILKLDGHLVCLVHTDSAMGQGRFEYVLRMYVAAKLGRLDVELTYARAVNTLRQYGLIDIEPSSDTPAPEGLGAKVSVHSLTGTVLLGILRKHVRIVHDTLALAIQLHWRSADWRSPVMPLNSLFDLTIKYRYLFAAFTLAASCDGKISGSEKACYRHVAQIDESHDDFHDHLLKRMLQDNW